VRLLEGGGFRLLEDGGFRLLEGETPGNPPILGPQPWTTTYYERSTESYVDQDRVTMVETSTDTYREG
jgi:hypothetical protein